MALKLALCLLLAAPAVSERDFPDMTSGRYDVRLSGLVCTVCTRAILAELAKIEDVEAAKADLERETLTITVKSNHLLKLKTLKKALARAARRANLGAQYQVAAVKYLP